LARAVADGGVWQSKVAALLQVDLQDWGSFRLDRGCSVHLTIELVNMRPAWIQWIPSTSSLSELGQSQNALWHPLFPLVDLVDLVDQVLATLYRES
jgi:hypothetical protein